MRSRGELCRIYIIGLFFASVLALPLLPLDKHYASLHYFFYFYNFS